MSDSRIVAAIKLPISIPKLVKETNKLTEQHGYLNCTEKFDHLLLIKPGDSDPMTCGCHHCDDLWREQLATLIGTGSWVLCRFMILCRECGNKRCPKAAHHNNACTGSNEPGQPGSAYPAPPMTEDRP